MRVMEDGGREGGMQEGNKIYIYICCLLHVPDWAGDGACNPGTCLCS